MKLQILILLALCSINAFAEGRVDPVPGGTRADYDFYRMWEDMVRHQKFPQLPHSKTFPKGEVKGTTDVQKRYIFQLDTRHVVTKEVIWDAGYWYFAYNSKEQGQFWLAVHPKYKKCFDNLTKKFDFMQWVTFHWGSIENWPTLVLERPRQCLGTVKESGSKLKTAKGALE